MKWYKHDTASLSDPTLARLGNRVGGEGMWIYWGIVTYIAGHGKDFQVKIEDFPATPAEAVEDFEGSEEDFRNIPQIPLKELAKPLYCTRKRLLSTITECVALGLFNQSKWERFGVLYSPMLVASQDEYSQKLEKNRDRARTLSRQTPEKVVLQEQVQEQEDIQEQVEEQKDLVDLSKSALNVEKLSTPDAQDTLVPPVSDDEIKQFRRLAVEDIREWNQRWAEKFEWIPSETEIAKLLRGGSHEHKLRLCYQAMNLLGGDATYPQVVRRAVGMMLDASRRKRITNPYGWLWTCLHGNAEGTPPWVQLATAGEER
jgi:hypothetical protein